jgi:hypothetical protein
MDGDRAGTRKVRARDINHHQRFWAIMNDPKPRWYGLWHSSAKLQCVSPECTERIRVAEYESLKTDGCCASQLTVTVVAADAGQKLAPVYVAVMIWKPTARDVVDQVLAPDAFTATLPRTFAPS